MRTQAQASDLVWRTASAQMKNGRSALTMKLRDYTQRRF
jgi:hypothetical protein